jgi:hypothetical protein
MLTTDLTYYIFEGVLTGFVEGKWFHMSALSGGAGGSTKAEPSSSANNPYLAGCGKSALATQRPTEVDIS